MARIPAAEIERLKREVSVERLAEARGVKRELSVSVRTRRPRRAAVGNGPGGEDERAVPRWPGVGAGGPRAGDRRKGAQLESTLGVSWASASV
jgi:hypothetical protein